MADAYLSGELGSAVGFAGAGAALGAIAQQNDQLSQQVSSGQLKMNPDAANKAADVYERKAEEVDDLAQAAAKLGRIDGLGEYRSAQELAAKFGQKAVGENGSADLLGKLRDELIQKADLFRQAARDYVATDEQIGEDLQRGSQA
ncbi:hypothetical protein SAMN05216215_1009201 [Saccharopolyspora shandongensis]|uniref:Excreted virulence factor EspC, type VII ESX diderm n=1 Tax=Saccharopolyspora shandongensis TaxID=418495 RepID=A0A1H3ANL5_9PSEU|nr:hypothetical protein [Saccharopolyspora shandongensis]SDX31203.1 hypothetical protein SAMN05216215_1009201 [Saccharopolyspora shandongensis]